MAGNIRQFCEKLQKRRLFFHEKYEIFAKRFPHFAGIQKELSNLARDRLRQMRQFEVDPVLKIDATSQSRVYVCAAVFNLTVP